jgi:eukaryotic-like serine/threonine-protein kinase
MPLTLGTRLSPYEILSLVGAGGMRDVYSRDTKFGPNVAHEALPEALAKDSERMSRFLREAQMLVSLRYSNIASIRRLEESGGVRLWRRPETLNNPPEFRLEAPADRIAHTWPPGR